MNEHQFRRLFPNASRSLFEANCPVSDAEPEPDKGPALANKHAREGTGVPSITVRFIGFRVRPLDPDNFAGSVKDLLDGLRHAALIPGDEPWRIRLETAQVRVGTFKEERTEIVIRYDR